LRLSRVGSELCISDSDVDRNQELSGRYRVQSVPTLMIFKNGDLKWRASGLHQADVLEAQLRANMD
ncbi:MAG: thioredoxin family protein, partial [Muribaculaceae bacterium]|nr:thioredoxin family protein [Muribaculaceae bacterium]